MALNTSRVFLTKTKNPTSLTCDTMRRAVHLDIITTAFHVKIKDIYNSYPHVNAEKGLSFMDVTTKTSPRTDGGWHYSSEQVCGYLERYIGQVCK